MATDRYQLSFTAGGLFLHEAPVIAARFLRCRDWRRTRAEIRDENLMQQRTAAAGTRLGKEVVTRLETLSVAELEELCDASTRDKGYLLWVAACRRYPASAAAAMQGVQCDVCAGCPWKPLN